MLISRLNSLKASVLQGCFVSLLWVLVETIRLRFNLFDWEGLVQDSFSYSDGFSWSSNSSLFTQQRSMLLPGIYQVYNFVTSQYNLWPLFVFFFLTLCSIIFLQALSRFMSARVACSATFLGMGSALDMHHIHSEPWSRGFLTLFLSFVLLSTDTSQAVSTRRIYTILGSISLFIGVILRPASLGFLISSVLVLLFSLRIKNFRINNPFTVSVIIATLLVATYIALAFFRSGTPGLSNLTNPQIFAKYMVHVDLNKLLLAENLDQKDKNFIETVYISTLKECRDYRIKSARVNFWIDQRTQDSYGSCFNSNLISAMVLSIGQEKNVWPLALNSSVTDQLRSFEKMQMGEFLSINFTSVQNERIARLNDELRAAVPWTSSYRAIFEQYLQSLLLLGRNLVILFALLFGSLLSLTRMRSIKLQRESYLAPLDFVVLKFLSLFLIIALPFGIALTSVLVYAQTRYIDFYGYFFALGLLLLAKTNWWR